VSVFPHQYRESVTTGKMDYWMKITLTIVGLFVSLGLLLGGYVTRKLDKRLKILLDYIKRYKIGRKNLTEMRRYT
jgi:Na+/melibiose symporter-like transporter